MTHSPIDEVAKRSRANLVEFLDPMRERVGFSLLCEKLGKETNGERERGGLGFSKKLWSSQGSLEV